MDTEEVKAEKTAHEHVATASFVGRIWMIAGAAIGGLPQVLDMLKLLPDGVQNLQSVQIITAVLGGLMLIIGNAKSTAARVAAINGEFLVKAAQAKAAGDAVAPVVEEVPAKEFPKV